MVTILLSQLTILKTKFSDVARYIRYLYIQAGSLVCAVRLANAMRLLGAAIRGFQRITLHDWQT